MATDLNPIFRNLRTKALPRELNRIPKSPIGIQSRQVGRRARERSRLARAAGDAADRKAAGPAAVDDELGAGHVGALVREQEEDGGPDLLGPAQAPHRDGALVLLALRRRVGRDL